jgi:predicted porin
MNKKLLAVAVAGAFTAAPLSAFAQSTVTISGFFKASMESISLHNYSPARAAGSNNNEGRLADDSSRIVFNVVEDLGGGMRAVAQADMRINIMNPSSGLPPMSGNTHVGLRGSWGQIRAGLQDLHYGGRESYLTDKGDLRADSISLLAYAAGGAQSIANATRTPNVVFYDTPEFFGGLTARAAYSFSPSNNGVNGVTSNPTAAAAAVLSASTGLTTGQGNQVPPSTSSDIASNTRHGAAWNLNPNWSANGLNLGLSLWQAKMDNPNGYVVGSTASADQSATRLYGSYLFGFGLRIGLAYDQSKLKGAQSTGGSGIAATGAAATATAIAAAVALNGQTISKRTVWSLPVSYAWGPWEVHAHYDKANNDKGILGSVAGTDYGANMFAISGQYNLSKRTSLALNYAQINNSKSAVYNFFTSTSLGSADAGLKAGEDPRLWSLTVRHAF